MDKDEECEVSTRAVVSLAVNHPAEFDKFDALAQRYYNTGNPRFLHAAQKIARKEERRLLR